MSAVTRWRRGVGCLLAFAAMGWARAGWIDESQAIFLPASIRAASSVPDEFPIFWKGIFLARAVDSPALKTLCQHLTRPEFAAYLSEVYCDYRTIKSNRVLEDWLADEPLRAPLPEARDFLKQARSGLALATLPGTPGSLLDVIRKDPFQAGSALLAIRAQSNLFKWSQGDGVFFDADQRVAFVPVSFNFSPREFKKTAEFLQLARAGCPDGCAQIELTGPHAASARNRDRVTADLSLVTWVGLALLATLIVALGRRNGPRLFMLALPLTVTVGVSVLLTVICFGSIHGLTLSFGPALVGLAADYGIYASVHRSTPASWRTNRMGLLTTLAGFMVLSFSQVPLIRQLMFFAIVGLVLAFIFYRALMSWGRYRVFLDVIERRIPSSVSHFAPAISYLLLGSLLLSFHVGIDLNLQNFEFRTPLQSALEKMFWSAQGKIYPAFLSHPAGTDYATLAHEWEWSRARGIQVDSVARYLPGPAEQARNLASWRQPDCAARLNFGSAELRSFYAPFREYHLCTNLPALAATGSPRAYISHLFASDGRSLTFWLAKSLDEERQIRAEFKDATSLRILLTSFPERLARELRWMFPTTLAICLGLLMFHYRRARSGRWSASLLAMLPLFSAVGTILLVLTLLGRSLSFVSLVGLLMIFGASVDYGIFRVDQILGGKPAEWKATWTALFIAAVTTTFGYLPMIAARHPVLNNLGVVLTAGVVGAFIGSVWGIPRVAERLRVGSGT